MKQINPVSSLERMLNENIRRQLSALAYKDMYFFMHLLEVDFYDNIASEIELLAEIEYGAI